MTQLSEIAGDFTARVVLEAQGTAGNTDSWVVLLADSNITITSVTIVPRAAITANGTNYFTLTLVNKGAANAGSTAVATRAWSATNSVANTAETMTLSSTAADLNVASGDVLSIDRTVAASGLASPRFLVVVKYKLR